MKNNRLSLLITAAVLFIAIVAYYLVREGGHQNGASSIANSTGMVATSSSGDPVRLPQSEVPSNPTSRKLLHSSDSETGEKSRVIGTYSVPFDESRVDAIIHITRQEDLSDTHVLEIVASTASTDGTVRIFSWEMSGLDPGGVAITYDGELVQECFLLPGENIISAEARPGPNVQLLFVNGQTGEPIEVRHVRVAGTQSPFEPGGSSFVNLASSRTFSRPGNSLTVESPLGSWMVVHAIAPGYGEALATVQVYEGAIHAIELPPAVHFTVELLDLQGKPAASISPQTAAAIKLIVSGIEHIPTLAGSRKNVLYADFPHVSAASGTWRIRLPDGLELHEYPPVNIAPGSSVELVATQL